MAENPQKSILFPLTTQPGVQRDGTELDSERYTDGQWVRFQRGRPKKMGGHQRITNQLDGPIRSTLVWSRASMNAIYSFSPSRIEMILVDGNGLGSSVIDRTPVGFSSDDNHVWTLATQYDDAVGSTGTVVVAHANSSLSNIDDSTPSKPFLGLVSDNSVFAEITDAPAVSGGVFAVPPYTFVHGSDGFLAWSDANQPQVWYTSSGNIGDAGADRVTGAKIVRGMALRSGSGPAALLWSLDSVLRMDWAGGNSIFRFSHLTTQSSILSQNSVVEYDGIYYWAGIDRFLMCDGGKVQELPNQMNINWFYDQLNFSQRQKVWGMKIPRFGEIHWYFPCGSSDEECTKCVIYNVNQQIWYDNELSRSAGFYSQVFRYPVMAGAEPSIDTLRITLDTVVGTFSVGDYVLGVTSGAYGVITQDLGSNSYYILLSNPGVEFIALEGAENTTSGGTANIAAVENLYSMYLHEKGVDAVEGGTVSAIESTFTTSSLGKPTGWVPRAAQLTANEWSRLTRVEPDFSQTGEMSVEVLGEEFANSPETVSLCYNFTSATERIDMREQQREFRLKFKSNVVGGDYEAGRILLHVETGDNRS